MSKDVPSTLTTIVTVMGVTLRRFERGRAVWVLAVIALVPAFIAALFAGRSGMVTVIAEAQLIIMALVPSILVASSIGEEIEDRTTTYLWSRPIARWAMIAGKLLALTPIAVLLVCLGWEAAAHVATSESISFRHTLAYGAGTVAISMIAAGIALLVPRQGMALSIAYLVIIDMIIGGIPASLQNISVSHQVRVLRDVSETHILQPAITLAVIAGIWLAIGLARLRRLES